MREELKEQVKPGFGLGKLQQSYLKKQLKLNCVNLPLLLNIQRKRLHLLVVMMTTRTLPIVSNFSSVDVNWQMALAS